MFLWFLLELLRDSIMIVKFLRGVGFASYGTEPSAPEACLFEFRVKPPTLVRF